MASTVSQDQSDAGYINGFLLIPCALRVIKIQFAISHKGFGRIKYSGPISTSTSPTVNGPWTDCLFPKIVPVAVPCLWYHIIPDEVDASAGSDSPISRLGVSTMLRQLSRCPVQLPYGVYLPRHEYRTPSDKVPFFGI
ncbi:hypothetical protein ASPBRDRAFT_425526 [Aspergillus brasiliensis CBS 101740]|uniref:Uncharacterized protein n=1 Tax=Aspergillus brasiliensis (strain CBS 101740 / IMI 381727 / IBT 21946) TaxID=767769 RepID=A0A1L9U3X1_ASPBC|nr:hypothetical protein ASPBRDRAFT_425526 [Aspergillus brasiliensis CBS 101740]